MRWASGRRARNTAGIDGRLFLAALSEELPRTDGAVEFWSAICIS